MTFPRTTGSFAPLRVRLCLLIAVVLVGACGEDGEAARRAPRPDQDRAGAAPARETTSTRVEDPTSAPRARREGVVFVHGTSDLGDVSTLTCGGADDAWHCASAAAVTEYWTQPTIDSERKRTDGRLRPYVVVGCPLSAQTPWPNPTPVNPKGGAAEPGSAACVAAETATFLDGPDGKAGTDDDIDDVAIITHSGGSNVVRYILQQHSARAPFARVHAAARGFIGIAAPTHGTYLADRVFHFGLLAVGNKLLGGGFDDDGVDFIQTTKMALFNRDPAKLVDVSKDVAGVPAFMASGASADKDGDEAKVACGGASETKGLSVLHDLYLSATDALTFRDACSDGFISCQSAMALANGDASRVVFGQLGTTTIGRTRFRAHNQSRRDCDGLDVDIRGTVNAILASAATKAPKTLTGLAGPTTGRDVIGLGEPYVPLANSLTTREGALTLEAPISARASEIIRVRVEASTDPALLRGVLEAPANEGAVPVTFGRDRDGAVFATARVPSGASAGAWTLRVAETAADLDARRDARAAVWVASAGVHGAILATRVEHDDGGERLYVTARVNRGGRVGVHASLVDETNGAATLVSTTQASVDAGSNGATTELTVYLPHGVDRARLPAGRWVIRDVALVLHDEASTLDVRPRVEVDR